MKGLRILCILTTLLTLNLQFAQEAAAPEENLSLDNGPISSQFDYVVTKSGNYRADGVRYEVVKESNLYKLRKNVLDSLTAVNKITSELRATIAGHETTIVSLNKKLEETTGSFDGSQRRKGQYVIFGHASGESHL